MSIWADIYDRSTGENHRKEEIIFNEMVYSSEKHSEIIAHNWYKGVEYYVVNIGWHPCAYVVCEQDFLVKYSGDYDELDCIYVHGGVTFIGQLKELSGFPGNENFCFGWDYGHAGDYEGFYMNVASGRRYTTQMVVDECKNAIDDYLQVMEEDKYL
jgi:hypothetical protein